MPLRSSYSFPDLSSPKKGGQFMPVKLDLSTLQSIDVDLALEMANGVIDFFQSIYIDNGSNGQPLTLTFPNLYRIVVKANRQGVWPLILADNGPVRFTAASTGALIVPVILMNVAMPPVIWETV